MPSKEEKLIAVIKGIKALAYNDAMPARQILDRIRITCHQTLNEVA